MELKTYKGQQYYKCTKCSYSVKQWRGSSMTLEQWIVISDIINWTGIINIILYYAAMITFVFMIYKVAKTIKRG